MIKAAMVWVQNVGLVGLEEFDGDDDDNDGASDGVGNGDGDDAVNDGDDVNG